MQKNCQALLYKDFKLKEAKENSHPPKIGVITAGKRGILGNLFSRTKSILRLYV
jgi:hypothetical protein